MNKHGSLPNRPELLCRHGCRQQETYRHLFFDCRVCKPLWRAHFNTWQKIFLGTPTWRHVLFGTDLRLRQPAKVHSTGVNALWNVTCVTTFYTVWMTRNDKKHREFDAPPTSVLLEKIVKLIRAHVTSLVRLASANDDEDFEADIAYVKTHLKL